MKKQYELIAYDSEGNEVKKVFDKEWDAVMYALKHELLAYTIYEF